MTLQRKSDNHVLGHLAGSDDAANLALAARVLIDDMSLYLPQYIPSLSNQKLMLGYNVSKAAIELSKMKRSSFMKNVTIEKN